MPARFPISGLLAGFDHHQPFEAHASLNEERQRQLSLIVAQPGKPIGTSRHPRHDTSAARGGGGNFFR